MKTCLTFLVSILAFSVATCLSSQSEADWERYQPRALKSIVDAHDLRGLEHLKGVSARKNAMYVSADSFPSQTKLIYLGQSRPLPAKKTVLLNAWRKMLGEQAPPPQEFSTEVHFKGPNSIRHVGATIYG